MSLTPGSRINSQGFMVAVPTTLRTTFSMGTSQDLFEGWLEVSSGRQYDVTADGQRFILNRPIKTAEKPIIVTIDLPDAWLDSPHP